MQTAEYIHYSVKLINQ